MLLAVSPGATKVAPVKEEVYFFGGYRFSSSMTVAFGALQLIAGMLRVFYESRILAALLVVMTFAISSALVIMERNLPVTLIAFVAMALLAMIVRQAVVEDRTVSSSG